MDGRDNRVAQEGNYEKLVRQLNTLRVVVLLLLLFVAALYILDFPLTRGAVLVVCFCAGLVLISFCARCVQLNRMSKRASVRT
jgi:hypothetical protein